MTILRQAFEPMAFLFWGWFRSMITFALYGALASAVTRVFLGVGLGYVTSVSDNAALDNPERMLGWLLILFPSMIAGVLAAMRVGELDRMPVSGSGGATNSIRSASVLARLLQPQGLYSRNNVLELNTLATRRLGRELVEVQPCES